MQQKNFDLRARREYGGNMFESGMKEEYNNNGREKIYDENE